MTVNGNVQRLSFFIAFINYDEIGNAEKAKQCLKYVVVSNLLSGSYTNPFDAREAKVYANDKEIEAISTLRTAYDKCDVNIFVKAMREINKTPDPFIGKHLATMETDFQSRSIMSLIKSYRRIKLSHLAGRIGVDVSRLEDLLVALILDNAIFGRIDQVSGVLDLAQQTGGGGKKYAAIDHWTNALTVLETNLPQPHTQ